MTYIKNCCVTVCKFYVRSVGIYLKNTHPILHDYFKNQTESKQNEPIKTKQKPNQNKIFRDLIKLFQSIKNTLAK